MSSPPATELRTFLFQIKEVIENLNVMMNDRFVSVVKIILGSLPNKDLSSVYGKILQDFDEIKRAVTSARIQIEAKLSDADFEKIIVDSGSSTINMPSYMRVSFADDKKLANTLKTAIVLIEKFEEDNRVLKEYNMKLQEHVLEILFMDTGSIRERPTERPSPSPKEGKLPIYIPLASDNLLLIARESILLERYSVCKSAILFEYNMRSEVLGVNSLLNNQLIFHHNDRIKSKKFKSDRSHEAVAMKAEMQTDFLLFADRSIVFGDRDYSFNWDESETIELSAQQWQEQIAVLKAHHELMESIEVKLKAIKTVHSWHKA